MVHYMGTKEVLTKSMNRLEYNNYRGWELPSNEDGTDEGMLIEEVNSIIVNDNRHKGYISWLPMDMFINTYKISDSYLDRLAIELSELMTKIDKLETALIDNKIPAVAVEINNYQLVIMKEYSRILKHKSINNNEINNRLSN